jgi:hypothetical protein
MRVPLLLWLGGAPAALATGVSTDLTLAPLFAATRGTGAIQLADTSAPGTLRLGWALAYDRKPFVVVDDGGPQTVEVGSVIRDRVRGRLGVAVSAGRGTWFSASLPATAQWGGDVASLAVDGFGAGDLQVGVRTLLVDGPLHVGLNARVTAPTGRKSAWMGVDGPTGTVDVIVGGGTGSVTPQVLFGATARPRPPDVAGVALTVGPDLHGAVGVVGRAADRVDAYGQLLGRVIVDGVAAGVLDGAAGVAIEPRDGVRVDLTLARALIGGPGTGPFRAQVAFTWTAPTGAPPPAPAPTVDPLAWEPGQTLRIRDTLIEFRDPIAFPLREPVPASTSWPALARLARLLAEHPEVDHLLVECYVRHTGTTQRNYSLSLERARTLVDLLIAAGVERDRLSYRGLGELQAGPPGEGHVVIQGDVQIPFSVLVVTDAVVEAPPAHREEAELFLRSMGSSP